MIPKLIFSYECFSKKIAFINKNFNKYENGQTKYKD